MKIESNKRRPLGLPQPTNTRKSGNAYVGVPYSLRLAYNSGSLEDYQTTPTSSVSTDDYVKNTGNQFKKTTNPP